MWDDVTTYLIECTPFSLFSKPLLLARALRTETLRPPHTNNKRFAKCECPDKLQPWENAICMKTVLQSSTRHGVVDETEPHSSVRSFLYIADYCDHDGYKRFMVPTFYFANPIVDEKNTSFMYTTSSGGWNSDAFIREKLPRSWLIWPNGHNVLWHRRFILGNASWMKNSTEFIHETLHTWDPLPDLRSLEAENLEGSRFLCFWIWRSLEAKNLHTKKKK